MWILCKTASSVATLALVCSVAPEVGLGDAGPLPRMVEQIPVTNASHDCLAQSCELQGTAGTTGPLKEAGVRGWCDQSSGGGERADLRESALLLLSSPTPAAPFFFFFFSSPPCTYFVMFTYHFNTLKMAQVISMPI